MTSFPVHELRRGDPARVTFLHVVRLRGVDAAGFAELNRRIGPEPPEGLVFHANGPLDDGWATVGFWTSKADRDRFVRDRIMLVHGRIGRTAADRGPRAAQRAHRASRRNHGVARLSV